MAADVLTLDRATQGLFSLDIHKSNAYAEDVKFDLQPPKRSPLFSPRSVPDFEPVQEIRVNPELCMEQSPSKEWDVDVKGLMSTRKWLQNYGLRKNRLDMHQILPQIGFKHSDNYDKVAKKPICSRYGNNLFQKYFRSDGQTFNISCSKDQLRQIEARLTQAICLYKRRLEWLTSESRRIFGVMEEKSVAVIIDIKNMSPQQFEQYRTALQRIIKEQLANIAKFNLIRASEDLEAYRSHCVPVTGESLEGALEWVSNLDRCAAVSPTATCEAVMKAASDRNLEAVYLFTEGSACDGARELLKEKLTGSRLPVHVISYNCTDPETIRFLKDMARITGGKFHAYAVTMEMDSYEGLPVDADTNHTNIILKKKTYGGVPPGVGMREDVILLFEELEEARNNLAQIQGLLTNMPEKALGGDKGMSNNAENINETYMSSREWLNRHGLKPKRLGFYDILAGVAFKHQDGVVNLKTAPRNDDYQTDAVGKQKLVNAKYCDKFPHVRWKDGQVVHVQVTPEIHRAYEQRMMLTMEAMQQRIDWLQQGSRELFGTVIEDQIYILIDTSASMAPHIQFLKDKLFVLMQEQLRHKQKFNLVTFNSRSHSWKDSLVEVNEKNLQSAWQWIKALVCVGSTNTLASLRQALSDPSTQAIYLLTDGRPDQPPKSILAQVMLHPQVPIHTISFNCADKEANEFLCQLARDTGGRYHYYNEDGLELDGPEPWESEDIRLLKQEMESGLRNLEKVATLRDECAQLSWKKDDGKHKRCSRDHLLPERGRDVAQPPLDPRELYRQDNRPNSAPSFRYQPLPPGSNQRPSTAHGYRPTSARTGPSYSTHSIYAMSPRSRSQPGRSISARSYRPLTAAVTGYRQPKKNVAGHTRTSLLRSMSSNGSYGRPPWLLPETKELFDKQWNRQNQTNEEPGPQKKRMKGKKTRKNKLNNEKMSSKRWLSQHGLAAKKLTLVDALAPTFIPHKRRYIPILDKHVESKVFDDIMPMGHVSGDKMHIINPQAVKLDDYIDKVSKAVDKYNERLDKLVWDAIPKEAREEFESSQPVSFVENKYKLMQALDQNGWPISERDITLLENEIKKGESYIKQARDLKQAAKHRGEGLQEAQDYDDAAAAHDKQSEGVGDASGSKPGSKDKKKPRSKKVLDTMRGQKVIGRNDVDGFYYPGVVIKCPDSRHALVEYNDIGQQTIPSRFVIPVSGAIARPPVRIGDYVLARVVNQDTGLECYVPGVVHVTPQRYEDQAKFYTVTLYTTQEEHFLRWYLVKISKMRYDFLTKYIEEINKNKHNDDDDDDDRSHHDRSRSRTNTRSRSRSTSRSRSSSRSSNYTRSRSRSSSPSRTDSISGSVSSKYSGKSESTITDVERQKKKLKTWKKELEQQQRDNDKKQKKLRQKTKKLANLKKQLHRGSRQTQSEHQKLLKLIVDEIDENQKSRSGSTSSRTREWVSDYNKGKSPRVELGPDGNIVILPDGGNDPTLSDRPSPFLLELRQSLPSLREGEEVLARWSDEGWYYRGIIKERLDSGAYLVEDSTEALEKIWRENIIGDNDDADVTIQAMDAVVALHPSYSFSYAPGVVMEVTSDRHSKVRFYDGEESVLPREEVYHVPTQKFEADVAVIIEKEQQWVGAPVVARNDDTGMFQLGVIQERVGNGRQYVIEWSDSSRTVQNSLYVFGAFTKTHSLHTGDRVLAIAEPKALTYLPGWITAQNGDKIAVKFCDGSFSNQIDPLRSCFWLSQEYYDAAVHFYKAKV